MHYDAAKIPEKLKEIASTEDLAFHIAEPGRRYDAFHRLLVKCMVLEELYPLSIQQRLDLATRQSLYRKATDTADVILQRRANQRYGPFAVVMHDHIGVIAESQEAIQANAQRLCRWVNEMEIQAAAKLPYQKPKTHTKAS